MDTKIKRILIVDDEEDLCEILQYNLGNEGYITEVAHSAEEALRKPLHNFDLLLLDVMMGSISGFKMADTIRKEKNVNVPIIFLTAKDTENDILTGFSLGADDYIPKPFNMAELKARVANLIEQRKRLRERYSQEITLEPGDISVTPLDEQFLKKAIVIVEKHLSDENFDLPGFSEEMNMSRSTLFRKLHALTDQSPTEFIRTIRLKRAASLLKQNFGNVTQVSMEVGFNNLPYFNRSFKKHFGVTPSVYQKQT